MVGEFSRGVRYFLKGTGLVTRPGLRIFVLAPLLINLVIFGLFSYWAFAWFSGWVEGLTSYLPDWLNELLPDWVLQVFNWLLLLTFGLLLLITMGFSFSLVANMIAAPFNGLLAERVEQYLTGKTPPPESLPAMIWRTLGRELRKWVYFFPRTLAIMLACLILFFMPGLNLFIPVITFIWGAWSMSMQYIDYPADNHQLPFDNIKQTAQKRKPLHFGFGMVVFGLTTVPLVNFVIMPVAICGATALWLEELQVTESS
jgi:CysZ protein